MSSDYQKYTDYRNDQDNRYQYEMPPKPRRNRTRNRNRRRNSKDRQRNDSTTSSERYNQGYFRPRAQSNVSVGAHSTVSVATNDSKRGSHYDSDYGQQENGQNNRNNRWDRDRLSREIWSYYLENTQTQDLLTKKTRLKEALHKIMVNNFPNYDISLYIVGSTATGLADNNSDIDICIVMNEIDPKAKETPEVDEYEEKTPVSDELVSIVNESPEQKESPKKESPKKESPKKDSPIKTEVKTEGNDTTTTAEDSDFEVDKPRDRSDTTSNGTNGKSDPMLEKIQEVLKDYNFVTEMQIILAKVPILKFVDRISGIEVTLNVNKYVSIRNTHLIHDYTKLDWRVQPLLVIIKAWAKDHSIKDAYNRSISSYSLVLMVIHYLQYACTPPVLPNLQKLDPNRYDPNADITTIRMSRRPKNWKSHNELSLKELLIGFLDYYSYTFCFSKDAISVRLGQTLPKHMVRNFKSENNSFSHWKYLCIEEPFDRSNTARSVYDQVIFERILSVFRVSHYTLRRYPFLDSVMAAKQI